MPALVVATPAPYEASAGEVRGTVGVGVTGIALFLRDGRKVRLLVRSTVNRAGAFRIAPHGLPVGDRTLMVVAYSGTRRIATARISPVYGLPAKAFVVRRARRTDRRAQIALAGLARPATTAVFIQGMATGAAASWNAGARFTAASTLKLAILMTSLTRHQGRPPAASRWSSYVRMIQDSDNRAANEVEEEMGGSTLGGSRLVNDFCRAMGCLDTDMYGGYSTTEEPRSRRQAGPIPPATIDQAPAIPTYGKHTTAHDLGTLATALVAAAAGKGRAARAGIDRGEARVAIWLLLHARYPGVVRPHLGVAVGHKSGWLAGVEHDVALVFDPGGTAVVVVLSQGPGAGPTATGRYGGAVLDAALDRIERVRSSR